MKNFDQEVFLTPHTFDSIKINTRNVNITELIRPLLEKRNDPFTRIHNESLDVIEELVTSDLGKINYFYSKPSKIENTEFFVLPKIEPSYHLSLECKSLQYELLNFKVPEEIQRRGKKACLEFNNWFWNQWKGNLDLRKISRKILIKYGFDWNEGPNIKTVSCCSCKNYNLELLDSKIIQSIKNFLFVEKINQSKSEQLLNPKYKWDSKKSKNLFREHLATYVAVARNPKLFFKGNLMDQIGIPICKECEKKING